jgi:hypothetical protein
MIALTFHLLVDQLLLLTVELDGESGQHHAGNQDGNQE